ncbi:GMC oxidoreductase [Pleomassaria siparia CBS 279.74]|uniref:GMC oxidoreductase n=1 Tax=Pleomassaria siparia CBS 279.74 TaxID=1314801 RepID=A0A6G1KA48_9PLEO|nr:GMC oxidoreductase [Pleomassaria siparia CBS 279.74]
MSAEEFTSKSYDYIVIGGGTAGLVVAARLSEDPNVTVAVLEAGGNRLDDPLIDGPNLFLNLWDKPEYDWCYKTVPQKGTVNRVHGWARGKVLGGSSAINYNMFSMASRQDLDNWKGLGNNGWGFDDLAPYYRKFETYHPPSKILSPKINDKYVDPLLRGTSGPIQISFCEADFAWQQEAWPETCVNAGYPTPGDPRSGSAIGGFNQLTTVDPKTVKRSYSARAYYEPNAGRENLSLLTNALVEKIQFEKGGSGDATATGVKFLVDGQAYTAKANKEVIVCGGTINSPQILELSGIGSTSVLHKAGVDDIVVDNPNVGENLNDHTATGLSFAVKDEYPTAEVILRNPEIAQQAMEAYIQHKVGPFTNTITTTGFTSLDMVDGKLPEMQKHIQTIVEDFQKAYPNADPAGRNVLLARQLMDPKEAVCQLVLLAIGADIGNAGLPSKIFTHDAPGNWGTLAVCSTRSLSRGNVHIESSDPTKQPVIDPAYFSHPLDMDMTARAMIHSMSLLTYEPLSSKLKKDSEGNIILHPSWGKGVPKNIEEMKDFVAANTITEYHPVGTCAMLPKEKGGVVDSKLKVYGTSNVRVVDASIVPTHVQGNIVSLVYALAEKGVDLIKEGQTNGVNGH